MSDIILPQSYLRRQAALRHAGLFTFVTREDVGEGSIELDRFKAHVSSMRAENLISFISMTSVLLTNAPSPQAVLHPQQCALAQQVCAPEIADKIERQIKSGERDALTSEEQLLQSAMFAILYGQPGPAQDLPNEAIGSLGMFLLEVNELIKESGDANKLSPKDLLIKLSMRHHSRTLQEQPRYLLVRYYDLLVTRSREKGNPNFEFDPVMSHTTKLGIEEFMALAFLYYAPFGQISEASQLVARNFWGVVREVETRIRKTELRESVRSLFSNTRAGFRKAFKGGAQNPLDISLLPFKKRPFYRTGNGSVLPISLPFVLEKFSAGTYWTLHGWYCDQGETAINSFTSFVGTLFQEYLTDLLLRTYSGDICYDQCYHHEQEIVAASPKAPRGVDPPFDGILVSNDTIVIFEMTVRGIPVTVLEKGNPKEFSEIVKERLGEKFEQLKRACTGLADGTWCVPGLERKKIRHIFPVVALLHPYPQNVATWELLQEYLPHPEWIQCGSELLTAQVHHAQILTAEELEMLEPLLHNGKQSLPAMLKAKTDDPSTAVKSMKDFLLRDLGVEELLNEYMLKRYTEITQHMRQTITDQVDLPSG